MGPFQVLAEVATGRTDRFDALFRWLEARAARVPEPHRDDVLQGVALKLLSDAPAVFGALLRWDPALAARAPTPEAVLALPPAELEGADRRMAAYVGRMMRNRYLDRVRGPHASSVSLEAAPEPRAEVFDLDLVVDYRAALDGIDRVRAALSEADRRALEQVEDLSDGRTTMDALVDADLRARGVDTSDAAERRASRDRFYTRHRRARARFRERLRAAVDAGELPAELGAIARRWLDAQKRRQNTAGSHVNGGED